MNRILIFSGIVALIGGIILFLYKQNQKVNIELTKTKEIVKIKDIEIKVKNDIVETKKYQKKLVSKPATSADVTYRRKWLQLVYQKRNSTSSSK